MRSIEGVSRALEEDCADSLNEAGRDALRRIVGSTVKMGQLIDGLLNLSRVSRTEVRGRSVELSSLAREIVADLRQGEDGRQDDCVVAESRGAAGEPAPLRALPPHRIGQRWK